jgi:hypothetical protein
MNARLRLTLGSIVSLAAAVGTGCSGGGGGGGGGSNAMTIVQCSLQCNDSALLPQVSCGVTNVFVNQEIRISFSNPIDPTSVSNNSFQMLDPQGKAPAASFTIDSLDPRTLIYRPEVTFDSSGNPIFGLTEDQSYSFKIPGKNNGDLQPFIRDTLGNVNSKRLECTLVASQGIRDANPGRPRASVFVLRAETAACMEPGAEIPDFVRFGEDDSGCPIVGEEVGDPRFFIATQATRVHRNSPVRIVFDDVMNPATLANPVTGDSSFVRAFVDADGNILDRSDQVRLEGSFTVTIDQTVPPSTTLIFTPAGGFPSAGVDDAHPRTIVIELSPQISDLGGNALINPGNFAFVPEKILFAPLMITEPFVDPSREDQVRTGSVWGSGMLATGPGGGSGRLGDLTVLPGNVVELNTDHETFASITNPLIFNPANIIDRPANFAVDGGVFEFARLRVDAGGTLRFKGSHPARIYVRGVADVQGLIDVSGGSGTLHASTDLDGGAGGTSGPNGGAGGRGGLRPDGSAFQGDFLPGFPIGGLPNIAAGPVDVLDASTYTFVNGVDGGGIPVPSTIDPSPTFVGGGKSGLGWPQPTTANSSLHMPQDVNDLSGMQFDPDAFCQYPVPAAPGGGGAHAFDGVLGDATFIPFTALTLPPDSPGGDNALLGVDDLVRSLSPELGLLRGGAGGGGGGAHLQFTQMNGTPLSPSNCTVPLGTGSLQIMSYLAHSSAGGGGGGGGLQLAAGRRLNLAGVIDASGGDGGSGTFPPNDNNPNDLAQAGGAGAGGSLLLQSARIQVLAVPGRIKVAGGEGGEGSGSIFPVEPSTGGDGSPGFLRMESTTPPVLANELPKILPQESALQANYGSGVSIEDIFTVAAWAPATDAPSGWSGAQSCWIRPTGSFFRLRFADDVTGQLGWDMRLKFTGQSEPQSFRGENLVFPGMTLEEVFGSDFGGAPVVVRFQGARAIDVLVDACSVPESGPGTPLAPSSLTAWKTHPAELNNDVNQALSPNIFRFIVLWDRSQPDFAGIEGLEELTVTMQPE